MSLEVGKWCIGRPAHRVRVDQETGSGGVELLEQMWWGGVLGS